MVQRKIKVLIITRSFPTKYNPVAAIWLLNQLEELKKFCNIKVIFSYAYVPKIKFLNPYYRFSQVPYKEKIKGILVYHPKYFMIPRIFFKLRLLHVYLTIENFFSYISSKKIVDRIIESWNPDIVHIHGSLSESLLSIRIKKKYKKPLLITTHGEDITLYSKKFPSKYLTKLTLRQSDEIICVSEFLKNEICDMGISKKFHIIPMGVDIRKFNSKNKLRVREKLKLPKNKKIILFVGHLVERKGVKYLIKAMESIVKKHKNFLCYIVGGGYLENDLKKLTRELQLDSSIIFLGAKKHNETAQYMNACDIFVLPSLNEGLPIVLCEALACGKPIVATRVAGTPEIVNEDVGFLVEPKNVRDLQEKIILALNKKWEKQKLLKRAKQFSVPVSAKKLMIVYRSFLGK